MHLKILQNNKIPSWVKKIQYWGGLSYSEKRNSEKAGGRRNYFFSETRKGRKIVNSSFSLSWHMCFLNSNRQGAFIC